MSRRRSTGDAAPRQPSLPRALLIAGVIAGAALVALLIAFAAQRQRGGPPAAEILGSQLPPAWRPGTGGVGAPPPPPPAEATAAADGVAPAPPPESPYGQPQARSPAEVAPTPPWWVPSPPAAAEATPPPPAAPGEEPGAGAYTPPRLVSLPEPRYPRMAERLAMEATVLLRVRVSSRGRVLEAEPIGDEIGYGFEAEAMRAARRARFEPARRDGVPVTADTRLAVQFRLRQ